jgi:hypothetical protein
LPYTIYNEKTGLMGDNFLKIFLKKLFFFR